MSRTLFAERRDIKQAIALSLKDAELVSPRVKSELGSPRVKAELSSPRVKAEGSPSPVKVSEMDRQPFDSLFEDFDS